MENICLDFYGEKTIIPFPKDFSSLSKKISEIIKLNLPEVFGLYISYTKDKNKKSIKSENDYKLFISSKVPIINIEIVELNKLNSITNKEEEDEAKLEDLIKKRAEIKLKMEQKQEESKKIKDEYKFKIESLNQKEAQYINNVNQLQKDIEDENKKEKELLSKITELSRELNVPLIFKYPTKGSIPIKGNIQKGKEYLELIKQYNAHHQIKEKLLIYKDNLMKNKISQKEIFTLKNEEKIISKEIENLEGKFVLPKEVPKNKEINDLLENIGKKIKSLVDKNENKQKELKEEINKKGYEQSEEEKDLLNKIEKENKQNIKEIDNWIEFISNHSQELIVSLEKKNAHNLKLLGGYQKIIDSNNSLKDILSGNVIDHIGATMPYTRYDTEQASLGGGAYIVYSPNHDEYNIASQGSKQSYIRLPSSGAYAEWTMKTTGNGVTMRFTLPDTVDGKGQNGSLDVYVNDKFEKKVELTSYYMWQYFPWGYMQDEPPGPPCFAFDETHFILNSSLKIGDKIRIQNSGANGLEYGVDFLEIEEVGNPIPPPKNSLSVTDFKKEGVNDNDAIEACIKEAYETGKNVYIPRGEYILDKILNIVGENMIISGAGIWYTNIKFTGDKSLEGGVSGAGTWTRNDGICKNIEFCHMYFNSNLRSRYKMKAIYSCIMDIWTNCFIHDIWEDHFIAGFWMGDYRQNKMEYSDGVKIINCRIRNNFADGVNFCLGTSNATVYNCSVRNNGDDGLATWNWDLYNAKDTKNNVFCYNTVELNWRSGAIGVTGGTGHKIYNNYIRDTHTSAGIHLTNMFEGYRYDNTKEINFINNVLIKTGTVKGNWEQECGAIDIFTGDEVIGDVKNVTFTNTYIYDSQHDALHLGENCKNIVFDNLYIFGTGTDDKQGNYLSLPHLGAAIMVYTPIESCFVNNIVLANIACKGTEYDSKILGNYINLNNVTINGETDLDKTHYNYPNEPRVGRIIVDGTIPEPEPIVKNKNIIINPNVVCYSCGKHINGVRFKCLICQEFDFCENCEDKDKGKHGHPLLKINRPEICPHSISYKL